MPLTDTQVRNAKPGNRPPIRHKGARNGDDDSSFAYPDGQEIVKNKHAGRKQKTPSKYNTKSGEPPKSYKLYDGENLYIEVFQNGSKIWRFRFKFPKENVGASYWQPSHLSLCPPRAAVRQCFTARYAFSC
jgi:hypothetical protein